MEKFLYRPSEAFADKLDNIKKNDQKGYTRIKQVIDRLLVNPGDADGIMVGRIHAVAASGEWVYSEPCTAVVDLPNRQFAAGWDVVGVVPGDGFHHRRTAAAGHGAGIFGGVSAVFWFKFVGVL